MLGIQARLYGRLPGDGDSNGHTGAIGSHRSYFMNEPVNDDMPRTTMNIRHMSAEQFSNLGVSQMAYVKQVVMNGAPAFAIHGADGTPMAVADDEAVARAAIVQHEMVPARVH